MCSYLRDNCIQNFHLGRYIILYTVGNLDVRQLVFWQLVVLSYYFTKFHDFSRFFQVFSNSMIFPCMELFLVIFQVSMTSRACRNPAYYMTRFSHSMTHFVPITFDVFFNNQLSINGFHPQSM